MPSSGQTIQLVRECPAVQIPSGVGSTLSAGMEVTVTQALGNSITVHYQGGLYRIAQADRDALGLPPENTTSNTSVSGPVDEAAVWGVLKTCYDPEIPVNIVDLGLVYDLAIEAMPSGGSRVGVKMTLTAPGCGMGTVIAGDAEEKIKALPGVDEAQVFIVWDPPWHQSMITADGRARLGL